MRFLPWVVLVGLLPWFAQGAEPGETKEQRDARMGWWREAKFGMLVCWSVYTVHGAAKDGSESSGWMYKEDVPVAEYAKLAKEFNPTKFDAEAYARLAKAAGMKYVVLVAKHHDGFAMFKSEASAFNIVDATPYGKDVTKMLAEACRKEGLRFGIYYSHAQDWFHPGGGIKNNEGAQPHWDKAQDGDMTQYIKDVAAPQVRELLTNYGKIDIFWWDTPYMMTPERADLFKPLLKLQPGIITNDRLVFDEDAAKRPDLGGDIKTPEQFVPDAGYPGHDWETCMTMNESWSFNPMDDKWKSTEVLLRHLIDIVSKGGNYLLDIGPTKEGLVPKEGVERLEQIGKWMAVNGEAIYGTTASPFQHPFPWGRATAKEGKIYLFVFDWPKDGKLAVPVTQKVAKAYLLAQPQGELTAAKGEGGVTVSLPAKAPDAMASVVVLEVE